MLEEKIKTELKKALKEKDVLKLEVLRGLVSAFTNELVSQGKKPQDQLNEDDILKVVKKAAKQRKDSIEQFEKGGRPELAKKEKEELEILEEYLPKNIDPEKLEKIVINKKEELSINDLSQKGILIGAVLKEIKSAGEEADGALVSQKIEEILS